MSDCVTQTYFSLLKALEVFILTYGTITILFCNNSNNNNNIVLSSTLFCSCFVFWSFFVNKDVCKLSLCADLVFFS